MFQSIFGTSNNNLNSPKNNVNMNPRKKSYMKSSSTTKMDSSNNLPSDIKAISQLMNELKIKDAAVTALSAKVDRLENEIRSNKFGADVKKRFHPISTVSNLINDNGRQRVKVGTRGSICTQNILEALGDPTKTKAQIISEKFLNIFQNPVNYVAYLTSPEFAAELTLVCKEVTGILEQEPRCLFMQSPVYVFGDIHGNLEDLHFFADNIWKLGLDLTAGQFLFLGDYVDRGMSCLECVAYLLGLKVLYPNKVFLLRGNHETRDVNGWEEHYKEKSFLFQCKDRFGLHLGESVWEECNLTFDRLPLASVIDHEIFCIHGGIPRPVAEYPTEVEAILAIPSVISIMPPYEHEAEWMKQVSTDCIWSDPASEDHEKGLDPSGFGDSPRGGGAVCFGSTAIDNFLATNSLSYIIRAHEAHAHGVSISKGARLTHPVYHTYDVEIDHRQGQRAMAGCILVDNDKIQVINRSPKYSNKYVHRRTSVSVENLSPRELEQRRKLGLVRFSLLTEDHAALLSHFTEEEIAEGNAALGESEYDETTDDQGSSSSQTMNNSDHFSVNTTNHKPNF